VILGVALGAIAGWRNGTKLDTFLLTASLTMYSIPTFALGIILLLVFAYFLSIFPLGGIATPASGFEGFEYIREQQHEILNLGTYTFKYSGNRFTIFNLENQSTGSITVYFLGHFTGSTMFIIAIVGIFVVAPITALLVTIYIIYRVIRWFSDKMITK